MHLCGASVQSRRARFTVRLSLGSRSLWSPNSIKPSHLFLQQLPDIPQSRPKSTIVLEHSGRMVASIRSSVFTKCSLKTTASKWGFTKSIWPDSRSDELPTTRRRVQETKLPHQYHHVITTHGQPRMPPFGTQALYHEESSERR